MQERQEIRVAALELAIKKGHTDLKLLAVAEAFEKYINSGIDHFAGARKKYEL